MNMKIEAGRQDSAHCKNDGLCMLVCDLEMLSQPAGQVLSKCPCWKLHVEKGGNLKVCNDVVWAGAEEEEEEEEEEEDAAVVTQHNELTYFVQQLEMQQLQEQQQLNHPQS